MKRNRWFQIFGLLVMTSMILVACAPTASPTTAPTQPVVTEAPTQAAVPTTAPATEAPTTAPATEAPTTAQVGS